MAALRFLSGSKDVDATLKADIVKIGGFSDDQLASFIKILLRFVCAGNGAGAGSTTAGAKLLEEVRGFADAHHVNARALKNLVRSMLLFFQGALRHNLTPSHVAADLAALGLKEGAATIVSAQWSNAVSGLAAAVATQALSVDRLVDMEWRFGVTASTSELKSVGATFLQLKLVLDKRDGTGTEAVHMELTLPQFYEFLAKPVERCCRNTALFFPDRARMLIPAQLLCNSMTGWRSARPTLIIWPTSEREQRCSRTSERVVCGVV